ncbi:glucosaminidase domain-containing protein [Alkalimonas collagenimarina]|uniref:Glucosaminidase domain-containing protein n=1 Tax=Alkalimonas collagenimarina TaxID=400390 RepID=A0ABT9H257_9GAMM|nr:glucosaminidase domain-containing protein [Alkalimonas collagenimarina]MDP4537395.1 glucosaminidase domain-containing protein [Alkalimonas collagenimarina]
MRNLTYLMFVCVWLMVAYALVYPFIQQPDVEEVWLEPLQHPSRAEVQPYLTKPSVKERIAYPVPAPEFSPLPDFNEISDIHEKKQAFFNYLGPYVYRENARLRALRADLTVLQQRIQDHDALSMNDYAFIYRLYDEFRMSDDDVSEQGITELLKRVDVLPSSLVLMQAANESAWGTSRFAVEGLNFFGQWCFREGCGLIPLSRGDEQFHEVARFDSAEASIRSYFYNLNTFHTYEELRDIRADLRSRNRPVRGVNLAPGLSRYSERGEDYIAEIKGMIRFNCPILEEVRQQVAISPSC